MRRSDLAGISASGDALAQLITGGIQKKAQLKQQGEIEAANQAAQAAQKAALDQEAIDANLARAQEQAEAMGLRRGKYSLSANQTGFGINPEAPDPLKNLLRPLTPAQETAEKATGKAIADWTAAGGRPAMEKNLQALQDVEGDLSENKRDSYDRVVGGALSGFPTLMGLLAPTEKGRRDKARSTANNVARQSDPNPTQQQIETIMGQLYDPSSSNEENASRIGRFKQEQEQKAAQMEQAAQNYGRTGYATLGNPQVSAPLQQPAGGLDPAKKARLEQLRAKHRGGR